MYSLVRQAGILLVKIFSRGVEGIRHLFARNRQKPDFTPVMYSYFLNEVEQLGITSKLLKNNVLQLRKNGTVHNMYTAYTDLDGEGTLRTAGDNVISLEMLKEAGVPVPGHVVLRRGDFIGALRFKRQVGGPVVVKPARFTGDSRGVFIKPEGYFALWYAVNYAGIFGKEIIVEEFFQGQNYRLLYCKGKFLRASLRQQAQVVGDGKSSIQELIEKANQGRREPGDYSLFSRQTRPILYKIEISGPLKKWIWKQGFRLGSVPEKGQAVQLHEICHWLKGGEYRDVTDVIAPELVEAGRRAVEVTGIKLAGVDMIAKDIKDPAPGSYVINEVNTSPHLLVHYEVQNQSQMHPVARDIVKMMFDLNQSSH